MRHVRGYYVSCRNPLTKQENAFINLGCIFVAIRDRLGSFRLLAHPVDPTHPQTWDAMVLVALGQASWKHDQWAQMHRAYSAIQPRKRHPRVGISSNQLLREHGFGVREHSSGASSVGWLSV